MKRSIIGATQTMQINNHYINAYFGRDMDASEKPYFIVAWIEGEMIESNFASRRDCENAYTALIQTLISLKN